MPEHQSGDDRSSSTSYREAADNNANSLIINPPPPVEVGASSHDNEGGNRGPTMHNTTTVKDANMIPTLSNDVPRPPLSRLPEMMEVPNWATMSNSIADSFGLFEEGQNDIFDFAYDAVYTTIAMSIYEFKNFYIPILAIAIQAES